MRFALLCLVLLTGTATADSATATNESPQLTYTLGVDGQLAFGQMVSARVAARFELGVAPGHAIVLRAGVGKTSWWETESDDPTYREIMSRVGYRISSRYWFGGAELGQAWFKAKYRPEEQMNHDPQWFNDWTLTALVGVKFEDVRLSLDYTHDFTSPVRQIGLQLGINFVTL